MTSVRRPFALGILLAAAVLVGATSAVANEPRPLLPGDRLAPSEPECATRSAAVAGGGLAALQPTSETRAPQPRPVIRIPGAFPEPRPPDTDCLTDISLSLVLISPSGQKPTGADGTLSELSVPRSVLESGFATTLPAGSHTAAISDPGRGWKLIGTSCACSGGGVASLASFAQSAADPRTTSPRPVLKLEDLGRGGCRGAGVSLGQAGVATANLPLGQPRVVSASQPRPLIPWPPGTGASGRQASARLTWSPSGEISISDPHGVGGTFACTWTVEQKPLTPKPGLWRVRDGAGTLTCGGKSTTLPGDTNFARLKVRKNGDRLVSRDTSGRAPAITLDREADGAPRYVGQTNLPTGSGGTARHDLTFDVVTEERITGKAVAKFRANGQRCRIVRPFTARWQGD